MTARATVVAGLALVTPMAAPVAAAPTTANTTTAVPVRADDLGKSYSRCGAQNFCLFEHVDGGGEVVGYRGEHANVGTFNDRTSSIKNRTGRLWSVYDHVNFGGRCLPVAADYTGNVTQYNMNDRISSARPGGCPA